MKKKLISLLCFILALITVFPSCSPALVMEEERENKTQESEISETVLETEPTNQTEEEEKQIMQKGDPKEDDTINILMIGNSFCYYYVDELYNIAKEAGVKMRVYNLYYSGCSVIKHWDWFQKDESQCELFTTDEKGRRSKKNISLKTSLRQENWDIISLQSSGGTMNSIQDTDKIQAAKEKAMSAAKGLYGYLKEQFPLSDLYWQETWAFQVGYDRSNGKIETKEAQDNQRLVIQAIQRPIVTENGVNLIPTGEAWYLARQNPVVGDNLCARRGVKNDKGDNYHDGDIGGGQYLNACVWFEVLTGKSCIGNTWRPKYDLSEEKIAALQQAAHTTVSNFYGENYAK